ncbi:MAG: SDR family NAD(P)-dependent oxidoreductase [Burkholderiales bacterium]
MTRLFHISFKGAIVSSLYACLLLQLAACATGHLSQKDQSSLAGKTYVVTGASSGIGRGVAHELGSHGANVVLAARRSEVLEEVASEVRAAGGEPLVVTTDVSDPDDIQNLADSAVERFGRIDVWINNAGVGALGPFEDIPLEDHSRLIDVNLKGVIYGSHTAMRQFRAQGAGTLVNVGSIDSEVPHAFQASYSASKAGVLSLGRTLNEELRLSGAKGISVATVLPWAVDTPFWMHAANYTGASPTFPAMDDPKKVVDAIVSVSLHPREELSVGSKAKSAYASHHIMPDVTERASGKLAQKYEMESPPRTSATTGSLHDPMDEGTTVDGGMRRR